MKYDVIIVGAGPSGMMAAITAAQNKNKVLLLERMDKPGKKILATGNGRCNFSNSYLDETCYRGGQPHFPYPMIEQFGLSELIAFFESLGMLITEQNGYYYPASMQASTVLDVLTEKLRALKVDILTGFYVEKAQKKKDTFRVFGNGKIFEAKHLILAAGGCAQENLGSNGSGYKLAKSFHHKVMEPFPALVALEGKGKYFSLISGVRNVSSMKVYANQDLIAEEKGEVQFTKYGISGIPVFQISRFAIDALRRKKKVTVLLDLMPNMFTLEETARAFQKTCGYKTVETFFQGFLNKKLVFAILKRLNIPPEKSIRKLKEEEFLKILHMIKEFPVEICGHKGYDMAQVTAGGVSTKEVVQGTLESKILGGLYITGELLDVDGTCGGYNLQWAFTSGYIAGKQIGKK